MRRLLHHAFLALTIAFSPISPVLADEPKAPSNPNQDQGDFVSLDQMQQGQTQTQNNLARAATLQNQMAAQAASPEVSFDQRPTYSAQIGVNDDFSARFQLTNNSPVIRNGYVMIGFTPSGTANTREFYRPITMPPGTTLRDIVITNAQLRAGGVTPGNYQLSFLAYNEQDQKIGSGFFGNPFSFGSAVPAVGSAPSYSPQINPGQDLVSTWTVGNTGDTTATITLLTVVTPAGTPNSQEFYRTGVAVPAGGGNPQMTVTAAQLSAAGFGAGRYLLTFVAFDSAERRIGEFFGNPLTIGSADVHLAAPTIPAQIGANDSLTIDFQTTNNGNFSDPLTALVVFTPVGSTDPADSIEMYVSGMSSNPGQTFHSIMRTGQQLRDRGINPGRWLVTVTAFNSLDQRLESYYGNLLTIGDINLGLPTRPVIPPAIDPSNGLPITFSFANTGDTADRATALVVLTPVGSTDPSQSKEFYFPGLTVAAGGTDHTVTITSAQLSAAGIGFGDWIVTATAFDGVERRLQDYFGNLLRIGEASLTVPAAPAYSDRVGSSEDFTAQWTFGNSGPVSADVSVLTVFTKVGTTNSIEVYRDGLVPANGGGTVNILLTPADRAVAGITAGDYTLTFKAFDADGNIIAEFFGNPLAIGEASLSLPAAPAYTDAVALSGDFGSTWNLGNSGSTSGTATLVASVIPVGGTDSDAVEFRKVVSVPAGGEAVSFVITNAELDAAGITGGRYRVSFVAFDPSGTRLGEFFAHPLTIGTIAPTFPAVPGYDDSIASGSAFSSDWGLGNTGDAPDRMTLVVAMTPAGSTDPSATKEFSRIVVLPAGGLSYAFTISPAELSAAGINPGDYVVTFAALNGVGQVIGQFFGNLLRIGESSLTVPAAPAYSDRIASNADFTAQWTFGNSGPVSADVQVLTVFTKVGTSNSIEIYRDGQVPANGGGTVNILLTPADRAAAGITAGDYTLTFKAFDANGNIIAEFFGNPLAIGEAALTLPAVPSYTDSIPLNGNLESLWTLGNSGSSSGSATLVVSVTPVGGTDSDTVEFRKVVSIPAGGEAVSFVITNAELDAAGITGGRYLTSFVAFDPSGTRLGEFFGNALTVGTIDPSFTQTPAYTNSIGTSSPFESDWTLGNTGDAPDRMTLVIAITPAGATDPSQTKEFSKVVALPPGGGAFDFDVTAQQLSDAGIGSGDYTVTFAAINGASSRVGQFFGNTLRIGESSLTVPAAPLYSDRIGSSEDFTAQWTFGNSGPVSADVQVLTVFTKVGTSNSIEIYRDGLVPANGGGTVNVLLTAADRAAAGITAGDYTVSFVAFDANGNRIGEFFGNPLFIGESQATFSAMPEYTGQLLEGRNFESDWTLGNTGPVSGTVTLVTSITPAGSTQAVEFNRNVSVPPGGSDFHLEITAAELQAAGIVPGSYTVSFVAVDAAGNRLGEFLGNTLEVIPAGTPIGFLLGQQLTSGARSGLVESWEVPAGDPNESLLADRACSYDQAIAAISLLFSGQNATARNILDAMALLEAGTGRVSAMYSVGPLASDFSAVYTGANAWFGDALATYELVTGDARFRPIAERIAETLLSFRDSSTGLLRGGLDADGNALPWISTEHNLDAYSFLDDLAFVTGDSRWRQAADDLSAAIDTHLWSVSHFLNGFGDDLVSLDSQAYGGIYWLSRGDIARADIVRTFIEENLKTTVDVNGTPVTGYAPYRGDSFIWVEGTAVVGILDSFLGRFDSARAIAVAIELFRAVSGGLGYASSTQHTSTSGADELFPSFANVASTGWGLILQAILEATPASSSAPTFSTQSSTPVISPSVSSLSSSAVFLPPTQGETKPPMSLYSQAAQQGFFNIAPGMFRLAYFSSGKRSDLSEDSFFSFLLEFLFG